VSVTNRFLKESLDFRKSLTNCFVRAFSGCPRSSGGIEAVATALVIVPSRNATS
jgi:hypothetical protein